MKKNNENFWQRVRIYAPWWPLLLAAPAALIALGLIFYSHSERSSTHSLKDRLRLLSTTAPEPAALATLFLTSFEAADAIPAPGTDLQDMLQKGSMTAAGRDKPTAKTTTKSMTDLSRDLSRQLDVAGEAVQQLRMGHSGLGIRTLEKEFPVQFAVLLDDWNELSESGAAIARKIQFIEQSRPTLVELSDALSRFAVLAGELNAMTDSGSTRLSKAYVRTAAGLGVDSIRVEEQIRSTVFRAHDQRNADVAPADAAAEATATGSVADQRAQVRTTDLIKKLASLENRAGSLLNGDKKRSIESAPNVSIEEIIRGFLEQTEVISGIVKGDDFYAGISSAFSTVSANAERAQRLGASVKQSAHLIAVDVDHQGILGEQLGIAGWVLLLLSLLALIASLVKQLRSGRAGAQPESVAYSSDNAVDELLEFFAVQFPDSAHELNEARLDDKIDEWVRVLREALDSPRPEAPDSPEEDAGRHHESEFLIDFLRDLAPEAELDTDCIGEERRRALAGLVEEVRERLKQLMREADPAEALTAAQAIVERALARVSALKASHQEQTRVLGQATEAVSTLHLSLGDIKGRIDDSLTKADSAPIQADADQSQPPPPLMSDYMAGMHTKVAGCHSQIMNLLGLVHTCTSLTEQIRNFSEKANTLALNSTIQLGVSDQASKAFVMTVDEIQRTVVEINSCSEQARVGMQSVHKEIKSLSASVDEYLIKLAEIEEMLNRSDDQPSADESLHTQMLSELKQLGDDIAAQIDNGAGGEQALRTLLQSAGDTTPLYDELESWLTELMHSFGEAQETAASARAQLFARRQTPVADSALDSAAVDDSAVGIVSGSTATLDPDLDDHVATDTDTDTDTHTDTDADADADAESEAGTDEPSGVEPAGLAALSASLAIAGSGASAEPSGAVGDQVDREIDRILDGVGKRAGEPDEVFSGQSSDVGTDLHESSVADDEAEASDSAALEIAPSEADPTPAELEEQPAEEIDLPSAADESFESTVADSTDSTAQESAAGVSTSTDSTAQESATAGTSTDSTAQESATAGTSTDSTAQESATADSTSTDSTAQDTTTAGASTSTDAPVYETTDHHQGATGDGLDVPVGHSAYAPPSDDAPKALEATLGEPADELEEQPAEEIDLPPAADESFESTVAHSTDSSAQESAIADGADSTTQESAAGTSTSTDAPVFETTDHHEGATDVGFDAPFSDSAHAPPSDDAAKALEATPAETALAAAELEEQPAAELDKQPAADIDSLAVVGEIIDSATAENTDVSVHQTPDHTTVAAVISDADLDARPGDGVDAQLPGDALTAHEALHSEATTVCAEFEEQPAAEVDRPPTPADTVDGEERETDADENGLASVSAIGVGDSAAPTSVDESPGDESRGRADPVTGADILTHAQPPISDGAVSRDGVSSTDEAGELKPEEGRQSFDATPVIPADGAVPAPADAGLVAQDDEISARPAAEEIAATQAQPAYAAVATPPLPDEEIVSATDAVLAQSPESPIPAHAEADSLAHADADTLAPADADTLAPADEEALAPADGAAPAPADAEATAPDDGSSVPSTADEADPVLAQSAHAVTQISASPDYDAESVADTSQTQTPESRTPPASVGAAPAPAVGEEGAPDDGSSVPSTADEAVAAQAQPIHSATEAPTPPPDNWDVTAPELTMASAPQSQAGVPVADSALAPDGEATAATATSATAVQPPDADTQSSQEAATLTPAPELEAGEADAPDPSPPIDAAVESTQVIDRDEIYQLLAQWLVPPAPPPIDMDNEQTDEILLLSRQGQAGDQSTADGAVSTAGTDPATVIPATTTTPDPASATTTPDPTATATTPDPASATATTPDPAVSVATPDSASAEVSTGSTGAFRPGGEQVSGATDNSSRPPVPSA